MYVCVYIYIYTHGTVEQVLDPRTMLVLGKFLKRGLFDDI